MPMKKLALRILKSLRPKSLMAELKNFKILAIDLGQWRSIIGEISVDKEGNPIPWYTYPAIEYLRRFNFSDKTIFEWGSGYSSLFWAKRAKEIVSIDDSQKWADIVFKNKLVNQKIILLEEKKDYVESILDQNKKFDVIVIDGKYRYECAKLAINCLSKGGIIILDNSDWFPKTVSMLRDHDLFQVDFSGFGPGNGYTWTTSLFFSLDINLNDLCSNHPLQPVGGLKEYGDE